jgi:hypothetical protein
LQEYVAEARQCGGRIVVPSQRLACLLPEFGGATIDKTGLLNVYLTDMRVIPRATSIMRYELELTRRSKLQFRFVRGDYSYRQLDSIAQQLGPDLVAAGLISVMVDEWVNKLRIGLPTEASIERAEAAIARLKLPRKAIILEKANPVQLLQSMTSRDPVTAFDV